MTVLEAITYIPGIVVILVGLGEIKSATTRTDKLRRLVPVLLAFVLVVVFSLQAILILDETSSYMPWITRTMILLAVLIALSGVFIKYSRRTSAVVMAFGGLLLVFYWAFLSLPRP